MAQPLSERIRSVLTDDEYAQLRATERLAHSRTVDISMNGKFPHWDFNRWMSVARTICVIVGVIFVAGGKWWQQQAAIGDIDGLKTSVAALSGKLSTITDQVKSNHDATEKRLDELGLAQGSMAADIRSTAAAVRSVTWAAMGRGRGGH